MTWAATIVSISAWVGLTLPGMIELPGSFSGSFSSPRPQRGPEPSRRMSLAILVQRDRDHVEHARQLDHRVVRGELGELVRRRGEGQLRQVGDFLGELLGEALRRIEAGTDRSPALRQAHAGAAARFRPARCSRSICAA